MRRGGEPGMKNCLENRLVLRVLKQTPPSRFEPSFIFDTCAGLSGRGVH